MRVAESSRINQLKPSSRLASMEPQLEGCGKAVAWTALPVLRPASMEPQLEGCGKLDLRLEDELPVAVASMEPQLEGCGKLPGWPRGCSDSWLQWSRNLRVAESAWSAATRPRCVRFNGAAT